MFFNSQHLRIIACRKRTDFSRKKKLHFLREKNALFFESFFSLVCDANLQFSIANRKSPSKITISFMPCSFRGNWMNIFRVFRRKKSCVFPRKKLTFFGADFCEFLQLENEIFDCKSIENIVNKCVFQFASFKNHFMQKTNRFFVENKKCVFL